MTRSYSLVDEIKDLVKINFLLGFEVNKPSKILIKTLNAVKYIESDIQNIKALRLDDHEACMGTLICGCSLFFYRHLVYRFFIKTHIIMSISTNI